MNYYLVWPADVSYQGEGPLTYTSEELLNRLQVVVVPLRRKQVVGVVAGKTTKPSFMVKPISRSLANLPLLPEYSLALFEWLHAYYPGPVGAALKLFLPSQLPSDKLIEADLRGEELKYKINNTLPLLTKEQQQVLDVATQPGSYLLHGETGTGKTRVYIELAKRQLELGNSAVTLTPEIALSSQLAKDFRHSFGDNVLVFHSNLSASQRRQIWLKCLSAKGPVIILGPRSALFLPIHKLGLVIVDEAHETAYKQEQTPHYNALRAAAKLSQLNRAIYVMGSATPLINDYYLAEQKNVPILRMRKLAVVSNVEAIKTTLVDLMDPLEQSKHVFLSNSLIKAMEQTLSNNQQVLLFLNRRGTARFVYCENCKWRALCPNCDLPLVFHHDQFVLRCHTCGHTQEITSNCPVCGEAKIVYRSGGTKAIADDVAKLFPMAKIKRFDNDNLTNDRLDKHFDDIKAGKVDIIIGTQTLAKGFDLPKLGLVGVILAETSLYFPDYTSSERTYQLLSQVIGRIGRGHLSGEAIIQSFDIDNPVIQGAVKRDWLSFYKSELKERASFNFPPYCSILKLTIERTNSSLAQKAALKLAGELAEKFDSTEVTGPTPAFYQKVRGKYRWQLIIKATQRSVLIDIIKELPSGWLYDIDPINLL